ncbi:MAG TPA: hypothetical protein DIV86_00850 [Alphaproteobacteria bacterium]|nr:hypothetical protein [Alphaproteobacteria bacterium]
MKLEKLKELNEKYRSVAKEISVLGTLNWPDMAKKEFLAEVEKGNYRLPEFDYTKKDLSEKKQRMQEVVDGCVDDNEPEVEFLRSNAESYVLALEMMEGVGTERVTEISKELYGSPYETLSGYKATSLAAAKYFLEVVASFKSEQEESESGEMTSQELASYIELNTNKVFRNNEINIVIDPNSSSRASVSSSRVKIRDNTLFKKYEARQLLHHEVFTHALCSINGAAQPVMTCMEFTSPRTTATQEGLAQFSELITGSIHLLRLKRIALRIVAIDMAIGGADLIDLFKFFRKHGDESEESYLSAMRIFRGGNPKGGIIFMKDAVYIKGMLEVYSFFLKSMRENNMNGLYALFSGKLTTGDVPLVNRMMEVGSVQMPKFLPMWFENIHHLTAILAFMQFATNLDDAA